VSQHRDDEALAWFASVVDNQGESITLSAPVHYARARLAAARGDVAIAESERARARAWYSGGRFAQVMR
jgi:hypothetical protein